MQQLKNNDVLNLRLPDVHKASYRETALALGLDTAEFCRRALMCGSRRIHSQAKFGPDADCSCGCDCYSEDK